MTNQLGFSEKNSPLRSIPSSLWFTIRDEPLGELVEKKLWKVTTRFQVPPLQFRESGGCCSSPHQDTTEDFHQSHSPPTACRGVGEEGRAWRLPQSLTDPGHTSVHCAHNQGGNTDSASLSKFHMRICHSLQVPAGNVDWEMASSPVIQYRDCKRVGMNASYQKQLALLWLPLRKLQQKQKDRAMI